MASREEVLKALLLLAKVKALIAEVGDWQLLYRLPFVRALVLREIRVT